MVSIKNGRYYGLNSIATDIWKHIENPLSVNEIVSILMEQYHTERVRCEVEVIAFIEKLYDQDLIETKLL